MEIRRRALLATGVGVVPAMALATDPAPGTLLDRASFTFDGIYLDAAFTHPLGRFAAAAGEAYIAARARDPQAVSPRRNARRAAVERFARLINADPADIAVVPSTMDGENLVNLALRTGAGVVTDALHYDASLAIYGEMARRGTPVAVVRPRADGRSDLADVRATIGRNTRLVAVSLVSSGTGFTHDLTELCAVAHARGALVYADIIQAAGATPVDVRASGVDFACCGTYKWLMGDFGTAFLYVRRDRRDRLHRVEVGWRLLRAQQGHALPYEPPGPALGSYELGKDTPALFEVSTPAWAALAVAAASIDAVLALGEERIAAHRAPLLAQLREGLARPDLLPLTPPGTPGPVLAYAVKGAARRFDAPLKAAGVTISTYDDRIRISPSVYNTPEDIDRLLAVLLKA